MILRLLTARVPGVNIGTFNELLRAQLTELRVQPGLLYVKLARRLQNDGSEEVVLIEEWRTPADLFEWTRGRLTVPRLLPGTEALIEALVIAHYEALDLSPEDLSQRLLGGPARDGAELAPEVARFAAGVAGPPPTDLPKPETHAQSA